MGRGEQLILTCIITSKGNFITTVTIVIVIVATVIVRVTPVIVTVSVIVFTISITSATVLYTGCNCYSFCYTCYSDGSKCYSYCCNCYRYSCITMHLWNKDFQCKGWKHLFCFTIRLLFLCRTLAHNFFQQTFVYHLFWLINCHTFALIIIMCTPFLSKLHICKYFLN